MNMTRKVNLLFFLVLSFTVLGQESDTSNNTNDGGELKRIQIKDTYSTTETSSSTTETDSSAATGDKDSKKGKRFSREDFLKGRAELDERIIMRSFFFGRNIFPSKYEGDKDLYRGTRIGPNTFSGSSLVYNCELEHWACVSTEDANKCIEEREREVKGFKRFFSCAYLTRYETDEQCETKQLELIAYSDPAILCRSDG
jgi:hypothetical protein